MSIQRVINLLICTYKRTITSVSDAAPNDCFIDLGNMITMKETHQGPLFLLLLFWGPPRIANAEFVIVGYVCIRLIDLENIIKCMIPYF